MVYLAFRFHFCPISRKFDYRLQHTDSRIHNRPSIFPCHFRKKCIATCIYIAFAFSGTQHNHIPVSMAIVHQITMTHSSDGIIISQMTMSQNRVIGIALIWSPHTSASGNRHTVIWSCTSLSIHQIIITILFVKVRSFRPNHMMHGTFPDFFAFTNKLHGLQIKFLNPYLPVPIITNSVLLVWSCSYIIAMNCSIFIFVKKQTGINPRSIFIQIIRIRPGTLRAFSSYNKIVSIRNICCNHVITPLKIPQGRCIDSPGMSGIFQMEL